MCSRSVNATRTHALKRGSIVSGGITSIKILCSEDQFIQSGGQSISRLLVWEDHFKGRANLS